MSQPIQQGVMGQLEATVQPGSGPQMQGMTGMDVAPGQTLGPVRVGNQRFNVPTQIVHPPAETITKAEYEKQQRRSRKTKDQPSIDQDRLDKLEGQIGQLVSAISSLVNPVPQPVPLLPTPTPQTLTTIVRSEELDPPGWGNNVDPEWSGDAFGGVDEEPEVDPKVKGVLDWIERTDVQRGFKRHLSTVHKRLRFDEWSPEFRDIFDEKFEAFIRDEKFVTRVVNVVQTFPYGNAADENSVGTFSCVLAGFLAMYCAFTDIAKQMEAE